MYFSALSSPQWEHTEGHCTFHTDSTMYKGSVLVGYANYTILLKRVVIATRMAAMSEGQAKSSK